MPRVTIYTGATLLRTFMTYPKTIFQPWKRHLNFIGKGRTERKLKMPLKRLRITVLHTILWYSYRLQITEQYGYGLWVMLNFSTGNVYGFMAHCRILMSRRKPR